MLTVEEFIYQPLAQLPGPIAARAQYVPPQIFSAAHKSSNTISSGVQESQHTQKYTVRGNKMRTKQTFFDELSAVLQFPQYFGENWDACEECLNDLYWIAADNIIVDFLFPEEVLYDSSTDFEIFAHIYQQIFLAQMRIMNLTNSIEHPQRHSLKFLLSTTQNQNTALAEKWSQPVISPVYWLV